VAAKGQHQDEEPEGGSRVRAATAAALAWALPGAGHFYLSRRGRAAIFASVILIAVVLGFLLEGNLYRSLGGDPLSILATLASMGMGLPYFVLRFGLDFTGQITAPGFDYGTSFLISAGLMNLLLVLDAWDIGTGQKE
jgi:hypothetical protein